MELVKNNKFNKKLYNSNKEYYDKKYHDDTFDIIQMVYIEANNINKDDCKCVCGKAKSQFTFSRGFKGKFCSNECTAKYRNDVDYKKRNEKSAKTKLKKYGDKNYNNSKKQKETLENTDSSIIKSRNKNKSIRMLNRTDEQIKSFVEKSAKTKLKKYGDKNYNNSKKQKETLEKLYGVENFSLKHIKHIENYNELYIRENFIVDGFLMVNDMKEYFGISYTAVGYIKERYKIIEPTKTKYGKSQNEIVEFIKSIYSGKIITNDRKLLNGKEIDILLPEINVGIEYNGLMFHSQGITKGFENIDKNYHLNKTNSAESKGYQLFHINENEWIDEMKGNIWKSVLSSKLNNTKRIFARKCIIKEVQSNEAKIFLDRCHLQGGMNSKYRFGLYFENKLVQIITIGKNRFGEGNEIHRICSELNTTVIGGVSKLLAHYSKKHKGILISYANRRWSQGNVYLKNNFEKMSITPPNIFYFKNDKIFNRMSLQKHKIKEFEFFDEKLTGQDNLYMNGFRSIYDSGNIKFMKDIK